VSFESQVVNPMRALYGAQEFALNPLQDYFSEVARNVLEQRSESYIRKNRSAMADEILALVRNKIESLGVRVLSVRRENIARI
jgi:hypothetical protein